MMEALKFYILKAASRVWLVFLFFSFDHSFGQLQSHARITGRITDASTGGPLPLVNVFLAGTTRGDATDKEGNYVIENIMPGTYELVASMVGYEMQKVTVRLFNKRDQIFNFALKSRILEGEAITVTAEDAEEWRKNLKIFTKMFFGAKPFAEEYQIVNPEVLDFTYDRETGEFRAFTDAPVIFINHALGYKATMVLGGFSMKLRKSSLPYLAVDNESFTKGHYQIKAEANFKELIPTNAEEQIKWEKNRLVAYRGSRRHFLTALCAGQLKQEGFKIRGAKVKQAPDGMLAAGSEYKLKIENILQATPDSSQRLLSFPEFLEVIYAKEKDNVQLRVYQLAREKWRKSNRRAPDGRILWDIEVTNIDDRYGHQRSLLKIFNGQSILISTRGVIIPGPTSLVALGYWYWDSADEWLPTDYEPPATNKN